MADEDAEEERVRRRRSRPSSGMIHHPASEFASAFEKALANTAAIYREEMLKGKLNALHRACQGNVHETCYGREGYG
jgi:hypothetical protein